MMKRQIVYILMIGTLLIPSILLGQNVSIQGKLDRAEIKTGEQAAIDLIIRTNNLPKTRFYLKDTPQGTEPYTVVEFGALDTVDIEGSLKEITARLVITSFDSTLITIPPIVVETPEGRAETSPMGLNVVQPQVDAKHPEHFKDIKQPWDIRLTLRDWLEFILTSWVFWLALVILVAGYSLYRYLIMPKPTREEAPENTIAQGAVYTPLQLAEQRLEELENLKMWEQGLYKEYYTILTEVLKVYLDASRGWSTIEMTTSELVDKLQADGLRRGLIEEIVNVLREADLSKFAKSQPSPDTAKSSLQSMWYILRALDEEYCPTKETDKV